MDKLGALKAYLLERGSSGLCVAFSGGVDSALLLKVAVDTLGSKASAVTFVSRLLPKAEPAEAESLAHSIGARHFFLTFDELADERITGNPTDRCYFCKHFIFSRLKQFCDENSLGAAADGTNADDLNEYRPGLRALRELGVLSPLSACGFTKSEVRAAAQTLGLPVFDKPSSPCLATRVPYGTPLSDDLLLKIERSEDALHTSGFAKCRVRAHGDVARVEIPPEYFDGFMAKRDEILAQLHGAGFTYVTLDMDGLRSGSMDLGLTQT